MIRVVNTDHSLLKLWIQENEELWRIEEPQVRINVKDEIICVIYSIK